MENLCRPKGARQRPGYTAAPPFSAPAETMVKTVGKYQIGKTLGEGTFGKVKFAINTETGENVAIKVLDKEKIQKQSMGAQVRLGDSLSHALVAARVLARLGVGRGHSLFSPSRHHESSPPLVRSRRRSLS